MLVLLITTALLWCKALSVAPVFHEDRDIAMSDTTTLVRTYTTTIATPTTLSQYFALPSGLQEQYQDWDSGSQLDRFTSLSDWNTLTTVTDEAVTTVPTNAEFVATNHISARDVYIAGQDNVLSGEIIAGICGGGFLVIGFIGVLIWKVVQWRERRKHGDIDDERLESPAGSVIMMSHRGVMPPPSRAHDAARNYGAGRFY